jgi:RNA polymerase sigma-B factor
VSSSAKRSEPSRRIRSRNQRVENHLALVNSVAGHYAARTAELRDDLHQVAALGLIRAAERYDSGSNVPFAAFARPHIRGAVLHYLRDVAPLVRVSRRLQERSRALRQCRLALASGTGHEATDAELCSQLGLSDRQWAQLVLTGLSGDTSTLSVRPLREADEQLQAPASESEHQQEESKAALHALQRLDDRQRQVVEAVVFQGLSLRAVAAREGSSAATVHRLLHQALAELRRLLIPASDARAC